MVHIDPEWTAALLVGGMEAVHTQGVWMAEGLQRATMGQRRMWLLATQLGDPNAAFLLLFPVTYYCSRATGVAVIWTAAVSEWLNLVFKWMLFGERPYWWIEESGVFRLQKPDVQQFPPTCETGPGSPSGHAMVTAAVWWVAASSLASHLFSWRHSRLLFALPYLLYLLLLMAVGLSRVFILAHFPHQVVAGAIAGMVLGQVLGHQVPRGSALMVISLVLLLGTLAIHTALMQLGVDLTWSIPLAFKWCHSSEWIRLDSVPFSSLARDCGALLGLGVVQHWRTGGWSPSKGSAAISLVLSGAALHLLRRLALPSQPHSLFYCLFFLKFLLVPQLVMVLVPTVVQLCTPRKWKDQ